MWRMEEKSSTMIWMMMLLKITKVNIHTIFHYTTFFLYFECQNLSKLFINSFVQRVISFVKMFCSKGKHALKERTPRKM